MIFLASCSESPAKAALDQRPVDRFPVDILHHQGTNAPPARLLDDIHADGLGSIPEKKGAPLA